MGKLILCDMGYDLYIFITFYNVIYINVHPIWFMCGVWECRCKTNHFLVAISWDTFTVGLMGFIYIINSVIFGYMWVCLKSRVPQKPAVYHHNLGYTIFVGFLCNETGKFGFKHQTWRNQSTLSLNQTTWTIHQPRQLYKQATNLQEFADLIK